MSYPFCRDLQQQTRVFDGVLCRAEVDPVNFSAGGEPQPVTAEIVSGSYFPVLGVGPALGRVLGSGRRWSPTAPSPVVVLSLWLLADAVRRRCSMSSAARSRSTITP